MGIVGNPICVNTMAIFVAPAPLWKRLRPMAKEDVIEMDGVVTETLPTMFGWSWITGTWSPRTSPGACKHYIRILTGDKVKVD
jgi:translation initiation factor IF-1